jgi:hypothetical protein
MNTGQDWCLQCGAGAPGSLGEAASWRSGAGILIVTAILALAAAAAAYAALNKGNGRTVGVTRTVAQTIPPPAAPAGTPAPAIPKSLATPTTVKPITPLAITKPPRIPLTARTPKPAVTSTPATSTPSSTTTTPPANSGTGESQPQAILLDTNAATTYNPYGYPPANFGDPSLAIDGETSTAWTAQVDPAVAPKMAEGLAIDLKSARKLSAVALITTTPGMIVQVYGTSARTVPTSITDPAWIKLSPSLPVKARHTRIKLKSAKAVRFVTLWISKAPAASVGTQQAPGHVSVNELELFP